MTGNRIETLSCGTPEVDLLERLYGEMDDIRQKSLDRHTNECASCAAWLSGGRDTLDALRASGLRDLATEEAPGSWPALRAELAAASRPQRVSAFGWKRLAQAAAALLLVGASFTMGRLWDRSGLPLPGGDTPAPDSGSPALDSQGRLLLFSQRTNDYLDRSRIVLLELANGDMAERHSLSEASRKLLQENSVARQVAREIADRRLQDLVDELEVLLGLISRMPDTESGQVERIRTYLNNSGVLEQLELLQAAPRLASDRRLT